MRSRIVYSRRAGGTKPRRRASLPPTPVSRDNPCGRRENFMATQTMSNEVTTLNARATTDAARDTREEIVSYDPATNEEIGRVPVRSAVEVRAAVERARAAQVDWAKKSFPERGRVVLRAREIALDEIDAIANLIARESGKPATEAIMMELVP